MAEKKITQKTIQAKQADSEKRFALWLIGKANTASYRAGSGKNGSIHPKINGKVYEVEIEEVKAGSQPTMSATPSQAPKASAPAGAGQAVEAPLQGSMFNILVKEGQAVKKGDVLAVLEAMKMENEIIAPIDGTVSAIHVEKGQNVNLGDTILEIA